jgi:hypothetical protein
LSGLADLPVLISQENVGLKSIRELKEYSKIRRLEQSTRAYLIGNTPQFERKRRDALLRLTPLSRMPTFPPAHISEVGDEIEVDGNEVDGEGEEGEGEGEAEEEGSGDEGGDGDEGGGGEEDNGSLYLVNR